MFKDTNTITIPRRSRFAITGGRLLVSKEFANAMGRPSDAGSEAGTISVGAVMQPTEITQVANGQPQSMVMPSVQHAVGPGAPNLVPGPDVIVGNIQNVAQHGERRDTGWFGDRNRLL